MNKYPNLTKIGESAISIAFSFQENSEKRVLLVSKRADYFPIYQKLKTNLDFLESKIATVKIPSQPRLIEPDIGHLYGVISFIYVPGQSLKSKLPTCTPAQKITIGQKLAEFINEMQNIDLTSFPQHKNREINLNNSKFKKSLALITPYLNEIENKKLTHIKEHYHQLMLESTFSLTHGDLQLENLLIDDDNNLVGIIDFANMGYYVPEVEFAPMLYSDPIIFNSMVKSFPQPLDLDHIKIINLTRRVRFFKHIIKCSRPIIEKEIIEIKNLLADYNF